VVDVQRALPSAACLATLAVNGEALLAFLLPLLRLNVVGVAFR
jgi:hypothetical protein